VQGGIFMDKEMLEVDRIGTRFDGNVYVCWTRFVANGQARIYFSRSTDGANTFSKPVAISGGGNIPAQGCDIAIEHDGDVVPGPDPREAFNDGFDVLQCRAALPGGTFGPDTCANAGGLNQNIYGISFTVP
jgi:hypothetical protein